MSEGEGQDFSGWAANNPGNRTITRSRSNARSTPPFIDTFRAKTTDIAKREPITKAGSLYLITRKPFRSFRPAPRLAYAYSFSFFLRVSSSVLPRLPENAPVPPLWRTVDPFIRKCQGRGKDGRSGGLARGREEYMDHRQTEKNEKNYWRMRHLFSFLLFGLLSIDPWFFRFESLKINVIRILWCH